MASTRLPKDDGQVIGIGLRKPFAPHFDPTSGTVQTIGELGMGPGRMQVEQMAQGGSSSNPDFFHDRLPSFQKNAEERFYKQVEQT
jgi:hypothetical protein